jgi:hypothetical protein
MGISVDKQEKIAIIGKPVYYGVRIIMALLGIFVVLMMIFSLKTTGILDSFFDQSMSNQIQIIAYPLGTLAIAVLAYLFVTKYLQQKKLNQKFEEASSFIEEFLLEDIEVIDEFELSDAKEIDENGAIKRLAEIEAKVIKPLDLQGLTQALSTESLKEEDLDLDLASPWLEYLFKHFISTENLIDVEDKAFVAYQKKDFLGYHKTDREVFYLPNETTANFLENEVGKSEVDLPPTKNNTEKRRVDYITALPILGRSMRLPWNAGDILTRIEKLLSPKSRFSKAYGDFLLFRSEDFAFWDSLYRCQSKEVRSIAYEILRTVKEFYDIIGNDDDVLGQANKVSIYTEFAAKFTTVRLLSKELSGYFESHGFEQSVEKAKEEFQERGLLVELASMYEGMTEQVRKNMPNEKLKIYEKAKDNLARLDEFVTMELAFESVKDRLKELKELINVEQIHALSGMIESLRQLVIKAKAQLNEKSEIDKITAENLDKLLQRAIDKIVSDSNLRIYSLCDNETIEELVDIYQQVKNIILEELEKLNLKVFDELSEVDNL